MPRPDSNLNSHQRAVLDVYRMALLQQRYRQSTVKGYGNLFRRFMIHISPRLPKELTADEVQQVVEKLANENKLGPGTKTSVSIALRFYYTNILGKREFTLTFHSESQKQEP